MVKRIVIGLGVLLLVASLAGALAPSALAIPTTIDYLIIDGIRYSPGEEITGERGRAHQTYYEGAGVYRVEFVGSPKFTKSGDNWVEYAFTEKSDYYQVQHPWSSVKFYDYYTEVWNEEFTEVKIYDDRWTVEYLNKQDRWTDSSYWNVTRSYEIVSDGIKLYRIGSTDIGQREEIYFFRDGSPCKIEIRQTCDEAQTIRFVWKPSGIVATTERNIIVGEFDQFTGQISGLNYYNSSGKFLQTIRWYNELAIIDTVDIITESHAQGRKATVTFGGFAIDAGGIACLDPETYYPDDDPETTSVDGFPYHIDAGGLTWAALIVAAGTHTDDAGDNLFPYNIKSHADANKWSDYLRSIILFNTSGLPDDALITAATLSIYGSAEDDDQNRDLDINVYSSNPASNTAVVAGDFDSLGTTAYCDTPIAHDDFIIANPFWNDFVFNATGLAAISKTSISKFGLRNANKDVAGVAPTWGAGNKDSYLQCYSADKGAGFKPTLVVTYELPGEEYPGTPAGFLLTAISNNEVNATWGMGANATGSLLLVSTKSYPNTPNSSYVIAYSGNATSVNLIGYNLEMATYYFSLWSYTNPTYSETYTTAKIGGDAMTEIANVLEQSSQLVFPLLALAIFSFLAFWKPNALLFMLAAGISLIVGLQWYDIYTTSAGLTIGLMLIAYSLVCVAFAFRCLFWRGTISEEE